MANGQISEKKIPLDVFGGVKATLTRQDGTTIEGVLTTSPTGEWEIIYTNSSTLRRVAQARSIGSQRVGTGAFSTLRINPKHLSVMGITILETKPAEGN